MGSYIAYKYGIFFVVEAQYGRIAFSPLSRVKRGVESRLAENNGDFYFSFSGLIIG